MPKPTKSYAAWSKDVLKALHASAPKLLGEALAAVHEDTVQDPSGRQLELSTWEIEVVA